MGRNGVINWTYARGLTTVGRIERQPSVEIPVVEPVALLSHGHAAECSRVDRSRFRRRRVAALFAIVALREWLVGHLTPGLPR